MACDVITFVRQECKEINLVQQQQQPKRSGSALARVCHEKRPVILSYCSFSSRPLMETERKDEHQQVLVSDKFPSS